MTDTHEEALDMHDAQQQSELDELAYENAEKERIEQLLKEEDEMYEYIDSFFNWD